MNVQREKRSGCELRGFDGGRVTAVVSLDDEAKRFSADKKMASHGSRNLIRGSIPQHALRRCKINRTFMAFL